MASFASQVKRSGAFGLLVGVSACAEDSGFEVLDVPIIWSGRQLEIRAEGDEWPFCGGSPQRLEETLLRFHEELDPYGRDVPFVRYTVLSSDSLYQTCAVGTLGCSLEGDVRVGRFAAFDTHEIVHTVRQTGPSLPGASFFEEGLAEVLSDGPREHGAPLEPFESGLPVAADTPANQYLAASRFVGDMIDDFGLVDTVAFMDAMDDNGASSLEGVDALFFSFFGEALSERWMATDERRQSQPCTSFNNRLHILDCDLEPVRIPAFSASAEPKPEPEPEPEPEWIGAGGGASGVFECVDPQVLGPRFGIMTVSRTFEIPEPGVYELEVRLGADEGEVFQKVEIAQCGWSCGGEIEYQFEESASFPTEWPAGVYIVRFSHDVSRPGDMKIRLSPL